MYGAVPPVTVKSTVPLFPPLQLTFPATALADSTVGSNTSTEVVAVHPLTSVIYTMYVSAVKPDISSVTSPLSQV